MKEFIVNLYRNPNFPMYCGIVIAVLASLFIIIFVLGKRDKKKFDETQALKLDEINKKNEEILAMQAAQAKEETIVNSEGATDTVDTPVVSPIYTPEMPISNPTTPISSRNPETEVVPVINPDDIPATPIDAMPIPVQKKDEEIYTVNDDLNEIVESFAPSTPQKFEEYPEIEPVMPEDTIEHMRALNADIEKDLNVLENASAPKVAPVEVLSDTLDVTPPTPVQPVQRPQVFSAVNAPVNNQNDNIDSL